ncbi:MAG: prepilin-type N-terminal cleavage/methylation domain-containing protein [Pseudomonadota bacterium]
MRSCITNSSSSQRGFTLLELLISLTLLGLILVLLFGGLRLSVRSWDVVQKQVDVLNSVRSVESLVRREMEQVYPYRWKTVPVQRYAFLGERHKVNFVAPLPSRIGVGGLYAIALELEQTNNGRRLTWKQVPINPLMQDFSALDAAKEMVLIGAELNAVDDIWLSYFGRETEAAAPRWVERWDSVTTMPMLVRIQVRFADGSEWPDFVVAPMLTSEGPR